MQADLIKEIANGGLGFASLIALIVVIFFQRADMRSFAREASRHLEEHRKVMADLADNIKRNNETLDVHNKITEGIYAVGGGKNSRR